MKKYFTFILVLLAGMSAFADGLPGFVSTGGIVKWYYMEVQNSHRFLTADGADLYVLEKASPNDIEGTARQLWSFTPSGEGVYTITNKYDGRQIDVGLSKKWSNWESLQMADTTAAHFSLDVKSGESGDTVRLVSDRPAPGGGDIFRYPSATEAAYNYFVWLVREEYSYTESSYFALESEPGEQSVRYSDADSVRYYRIVSAREGSGDMSVKDNTSAVDAEYKFIVSSEASDKTAEWSFKADDRGFVTISNRATGNLISPDVESVNDYTVPASAVAAATAGSWSLIYIGGGQYMIGGRGIDGVVRYLSNTYTGEPQLRPDTAALQGSSFAWKFTPAESVTGVNSATASAPVVSVVNGRVSVSGGADFEIYTSDGVRLPREAVLTKGIYIICTGGKTEKITVK